MAQNTAKSQSVFNPVGAATGDLSATYPNPTIAKIQGNAVKAQILGSDQDLFMLAWNNANNEWEPMSLDDVHTANYGILSFSGPLSLGGMVSGTYYKVPYNVAGSSHGITVDPSAGNYLFTIQTAGIYRVTANFSGNGSGATYQVSFFKNGSQAFYANRYDDQPTLAGANITVNADWITSLSVNDTIDCRIAGSSAGSINYNWQAIGNFTIRQII